jgi:hypothetical protein
VTADGHDGHDDPVSSEVPAVAKDFVANLSDARRIDEHATGGCLVCNARTVRIELNDVAVLREENLYMPVGATHDPGGYSRML